MMFLCKSIRATVRKNKYLLFGVIVGVSFTFFSLEIIENSCIFNSHLIQTRGSEVASIMLIDEYEPRINLAGKPLKAKKTPQDFIRPRYYSTELGIREKLFVAILTSPSTFDTFGVAVNKTIHHVVNKVVYFSEAEHKNGHSLVQSLVRFSDTRLILKPFHMLKYISDNFLNDYDYFYLMRDTTYVNGRKLLKIAESLSVSLDVHLGSGKQDELSTFCSIESGILLSSILMRRISANLDWCVKNAFSDIDDANVGRCIVHATGIPCMNEIHGVRYQGLRLINPKMSVEKIMKSSELLDAVSVWPIPSPDVMYQVHLHMSKKGIKRLNYEMGFLRHAIRNTTVVLPGNRTEPVSWPVGTPAANRPTNRFDLLRWDYFTDAKIYLQTDFSNVEILEGAPLIDVHNVLNATVAYFEKKYEGEMVYKRLVNGYRRFDPSRGMDYILDLAVRDVVTGQESHRRLEVCKPLGKVELVPVPYVTENTRVNLVLIVTAENKHLMLPFIQSYAAVCMEKRDKTSLLLILVYEANHPGKGLRNDIHSTVKAEALRQSKRFLRDNNKVTWVSVKLPARATLPPGILTILLLDLALKKFSADNLMLMCSANMELRQDYLNRVRMNTVKEHQVFSPIPFSEFHPLIVYGPDLQRPKEMDIKKNYGHYDVTNSNHISFYVRDFKDARKTIESLLPIAHTDKDLSVKWETNKLDGVKDTGLFGLFSRFSSLHVLRAAEPALCLRYFEKECGIPPDENCLEQRTLNLGPRNKLGKLVLDYHQNLNDHEKRL